MVSALDTDFAQCGESAGDSIAVFSLKMSLITCIVIPVHENSHNFKTKITPKPKTKTPEILLFDIRFTI